MRLKLLRLKFILCFVLIAAFVAAIIFLCCYVHSLLPAAAAVSVSYLISFATAISLLCGDSPSEFKCGWLTLIVLLPIAGAVLYFLSHISRIQKEEPSPLRTPCAVDGYEYYADGGTYLKRLTEIISTAKKRIYIEYYIISQGHIWGLIYKELELALARKVDVKIIYDDLGSAKKLPKKDFRALKKAGAEIKVFNKIVPFPVSRLNFRDHRKMTVVDGEAVFLGGVNLADEYANITSPYGYWKDGGILLLGEIAARYDEIFLSLFDGKEIEKSIPRNDGGTMEVLPVTDAPERVGSVCEDLLASAIYSATKRVYIFTPYLCAGGKLSDALAYARKRGVDVKIIIPAVPDKKLAYKITCSYARQLSLRGVSVFTYTPGFLHFKAVICDDKAFLGSYNFDFRSMRLNHENGVLCGGAIADEAILDFENSLALSAPFEYGRDNAIKKLGRSLLSLFAPLV